MFGYPIETIYLFGLIIAGSLTLLFVFFGDAVEGITGGIPFLSPTLVLAFMTFFFACGYILEMTALFSAFLSVFISIFSSAILVTLLHIFVLVPLSSAEESLSYHESELKGRVGHVITSIPVNGFGEVLLSSSVGSISKIAASFDNTPIPSGTKILVIESKNSVVSVTSYQPFEESLKGDTL
ncbi:MULTISPECIES: NfeD family protein [Metabacillus]|uniref:NfeD family protein n=1 Tax=Metabacillus TaxID=2675233 RepID=UPI003B82DB70